jgi:hypothetical protein
LLRSNTLLNCGVCVIRAHCPPVAADVKLDNSSQVVLSFVPGGWSDIMAVILCIFFRKFFISVLCDLKHMAQCDIRIIAPKLNNLLYCVSSVCLCIIAQTRPHNTLPTTGAVADWRSDPQSCGFAHCVDVGKETREDHGHYKHKHKHKHKHKLNSATELTSITTGGRREP